MPLYASRTSVSDGSFAIAVRACSAHASASRDFPADTSTRTSRPSRPMRLPNSDCPARSSASAPCARSGTAARSESANGAAVRRTMSCAVLDEPGSAPERISSSVAAPTRAYTFAAPSFRAADSIRPAWRIVSSIAVPSGSLSAATTTPSSTCGRISRGSWRPTITVRIRVTTDVAKTVRGCASDQAIPRSSASATLWPTGVSRPMNRSHQLALCGAGGSPPAASA